MLKRESTELSMTNRKNRSKSVTFLDEMESTATTASDDENLIIHEMKNYALTDGQSEFDMQAVTPSCGRKSLKTGDVRMHAGALTGVGPIRGIMKKSATDLALSTNLSADHSENESYNTHAHANDGLPKLHMSSLSTDECVVLNKSYATPNARKKQHSNVIQSDL